MNRKEFVNFIYPIIYNATQDTGIFPRVALAQAIAESRQTGDVFLKNELTLINKNLFGITASSTYKGKKALVQTWEAVKIGTYGNEKFLGEAKGSDGKTIYKYLRYFRAYNSYDECVRDYINVLKQPNYVRAGVFIAANELQQVAAIAKGGYATSPTYASFLVGIIKSVASFIPDIKKKIE